jgi:hypothetical protein
MHAYRFTTSVLAGPWRPSREEALRDAIEACQAVHDDAQPDGLAWRVSGQIEEADREVGPARRRSRR